MTVTLTLPQLALALAALLWLLSMLSGPQATPPPVIVVQTPPQTNGGLNLGWLLLALAGALLARWLWMG
ncbi:MAG: hypothetical protein JXA74_16205 [Anaerolineae bacterium]|nr:hypothetical protein [Anaerolineae bacterium]